MGQNVDLLGHGFKSHLLGIGRWVARAAQLGPYSRDHPSLAPEFGRPRSAFVLGVPKAAQKPWPNSRRNHGSECRSPGTRVQIPLARYREVILLLPAMALRPQVCTGAEAWTCRVHRTSNTHSAHLVQSLRQAFTNRKPQLVVSSDGPEPLTRAKTWPGPGSPGCPSIACL